MSRQSFQSKNTFENSPRKDMGSRGIEDIYEIVKPNTAASAISSSINRNLIQDPRNITQNVLRNCNMFRQKNQSV